MTFSLLSFTIHEKRFTYTFDMRRTGTARLDFLLLDINFSRVHYDGPEALHSIAWREMIYSACGDEGSIALTLLDNTTR